MTSDLQTAPEQKTETPKKIQVQAKQAEQAEQAEQAQPEPETAAQESEPTATLISLEEAKSLVEQGTQSLAVGNFEVAAEKLAMAVEAQVQHLGQYAPELAHSFYLYGRALLANAAQKNSVLGEKADDQVKAVEQSESVEEPSGKTFVFAEEEQAEEAVEDEKEEEDSGKPLQDIDLAEEADDLELAWENLDLARLILAKQEDQDSQHRLGDVHIALGEVSLESENFDQAVQDFQKAVDLKNGILAPDNRERAEAHYKLALALEYSEQIEAAIEHVNASFAVLNKRIETLKGTYEGKGKGTEITLGEQEALEVKEIEDLMPEMEAKLADLTAALEREEDGGVIGEQEEVEGESAPKEVNDISNLVKRKESAAPEETADAKKSKLD